MTGTRTGKLSQTGIGGQGQRDWDRNNDRDGSRDWNRGRGQGRRDMDRRIGT